MDEVFVALHLLLFDLLLFPLSTTLFAVPSRDVLLVARSLQSIILIRVEAKSKEEMTMTKREGWDIRGSSRTLL